MLSMLKRIGLIFCVLGCMLSSVWAQHYVFIESDGQPFYVKKAGKLYSSSANGFLIIPKLADGVVELNIGFPRNQFPELNFEFALMDRDRGFQLRKLDDKGWILFDRSSMETIGVGKLPEEIKVVVQEKKGFADVLMEVTGDKTLVSNVENKSRDEKEVISKEKIKAEVPLDSKQVIVVFNNNKEEKVDVEIDKSEIAKRPVPIKLAEEKSKANDDVKLQSKDDLVSNPDQKLKEERGKVDSLAKGEVVKKNTNLNSIVKADESKSVLVEETPKPDLGKSIRVCSSPFANEKDVKGLKKKILGIVSDQDIIEAVIKAMGERCYNCRQLAELSWMFTDEQVRLKLFQRAYARVSDPEKFSDLESTLVQDSTIAAFRNIMSQSN